jgi:hypothetical protein
VVAAGTALAQLATHDPLWVRVPVYAGDLLAFDLARGARIAGLGDPSGTGDRVATPVSAPPSADARAASVDRFFELSNTDARFLPGQAVRATLTLRGDDRGLTVPASALLLDAQGKSWVYERSAPHSFTRRRIEVDAQLGDDLIAQGLTPGVEVVVAGAAELWGTEFGKEPGADAD